MVAHASVRVATYVYVVQPIPVPRAQVPFHTRSNCKITYYMHVYIELAICERASSNLRIRSAAYTSAQGASAIPHDGRSNCKITYYMYVYIELATCMYKLTGQLPYIVVCKPAYINGSAHQLAGRRATPLWVV